jgi:hypothetical protein
MEELAGWSGWKFQISNLPPGDKESALPDGEKLASAHRLFKEEGRGGVGECVDTEKLRS